MKSHHAAIEVVGLCSAKFDDFYDSCHIVLGPSSPFIMQLANAPGGDMAILRNKPTKVSNISDVHCHFCHRCCY